MKYLIRTLLIFFLVAVAAGPLQAQKKKNRKKAKTQRTVSQKKKETAWQDRFGETGCQKNGKDDCGQITGAGNCFR